MNFHVEPRNFGSRPKILAPGRKFPLKTDKFRQNPDKLLPGIKNFCLEPKISVRDRKFLFETKKFLFGTENFCSRPKIPLKYQEFPYKIKEYKKNFHKNLKIIFKIPIFKIELINTFPMAEFQLVKSVTNHGAIFRRGNR